MQRVYGTAFLAEKDLKAHLTQIEEAKKRDHRKLGRELGLFTFHQWAPGAAFWLDKGTTLYNTLANYMRDVLFPAGYVEVKTPLIYNKALWERSGHWEHYRENMFLIDPGLNGPPGDNAGEMMSVKPMNCPGHFLAYASQAHSYRELPIRFHEQTPLHRNEASGVLSGLTRVRQFSQDDAHCFVTRDQIGDEVERLIRLVQRVYGDFGLSFTAKLSTRPEKFLGEIATWDRAEADLKAALERAAMDYAINAGDGAFYGPKIDFDVTDAIGRKWQCATIQLDYMQPENFDLKYTGANNAEHRPVVIHRAIFGSFERFIAILIEHMTGRSRGWPPSRLSSCRFRTVSAVRRLGARRLKAAGLRADLDERQERLDIRSGRRSCRRCPRCPSATASAEHTVSVRTRGRRSGASAGRFHHGAKDEIARKAGD
jgi:threonyl-tRNA synthetase